jgi:hypothetical protein
MRRRHRHWDTVLAVAFGVAFLVLLPVMAPVAFYLHCRDEKRMRATAVNFACLSCGGILGTEALQLADDAWASHFATLTQDSIRLRLVKNSDAICPHCGAHHKFIASGRSFILACPAGLRTAAHKKLEPRSD